MRPGCPARSFEKAPHHPNRAKSTAPRNTGTLRLADKGSQSPQLERTQTSRSAAFTE
jgi:hypothetical protein